MTLIAGLVTENGIVFAADSEESGVYRKSSVDKILSQTNPSGSSIVICGAGHGHLIDYTAQRILKEATPFGDLAKVLSQIEAVLREVFTDHVRLQPVRDIRDADFQLLIGIKAATDKRARLFSTSGIALTEQNKYQVCGSGSLVDYILSQTYSSPMSREDAMCACMNLLSVAKEYVDGVGGESHITILNDAGQIIVKPPWEVSAEENLAKTFTRISSRVFFATLRTVTGTDDQFNTALAEFGKEVRELRDKKKASDEVLKKFLEYWKKDKEEKERAAALQAANAVLAGADVSGPGAGPQPSLTEKSPG